MPPRGSCSAIWRRSSGSTYEFAETLEEKQVESAARARKRRDRRSALFMLQIIQPGLAGLMDGSVSTLAPIFAAAFATHKSWDAFLVGLAASLGRGHLDGIRRGAFRRRLAHRPRTPRRARARDGLDDRGWRNRPHVALLDREFSCWRLR